MEEASEDQIGNEINQPPWLRLVFFGVALALLGWMAYLLGAMSENLKWMRDIMPKMKEATQEWSRVPIQGGDESDG